MGKIVFGVTALFLVGYLTRKLGSGGFGECTTLFAWISTLIVVADMGLYMTGVRRMSMAAGTETETGTETGTRTLPDILGNLLSARVFVSFVIVMLAGVGLLLLPYDIRIKKIIIFTLPVVILVSCSRSFKSWFQADLIMHFSVICEISGCAVMGFLTYFMIEYAGFIHDPVYGVIFAVVSGCFVYFVLAVFFSISAKTFKISIDIKYIKELIIEAFPLGVSAVLAILYFRFDMLMLSWMKPVEHVGIYGAAYIVVEMSVVIPALFLGSMLPFFTKSIACDKKNLKHHYQKSFDVLVLLAIPGLAGGILLADPIMSLITGNEFALIPRIPGTPYLIIKQKGSGLAIMQRCSLLLLPFTMLIRFFGKLVMIAKRKEYYLVRPLVHAYCDFRIGKNRRDDYQVSGKKDQIGEYRLCLFG